MIIARLSRNLATIRLVEVKLLAERGVPDIIVRVEVCSSSPLRRAYYSSLEVAVNAIEFLG